MKSYLSKNQSIFLVIFILVLGSFILANPVQAGWFGDAVAQLIGWIVYAFVYVIGLLLMLVMWVLIKIAQYNDFINAEPVSYGWTIVRDVCNMFFILILLIIAFATILRVEKYSFKTLLPKLILMAVLINFSKLICGVFIDFTQVIMLTFVNGFKDIGTGNLTNMLGIDKIMKIDSSVANGEGAVSSWSIVGAYMLALMYSVIALITLVTMLAVLAMRMIMIWIYVVLSPLAYLLAAFPAGEKYASQWWEEFSKNLIVGPILAFFIWLSFVSLGGVETPAVVGRIAQTSGAADRDVAARTQELTNASSSDPSAAITEAGSPDHMIKFIISIAMLVGGLQISQSLGGQAGGMAGKGMAKIQGMGSSAMKGVGTGLKRATGVERVQMAYKTYQAGKATDRSIRATQDAGKISGAVGAVKAGIAKPIKGGMQKVSTGLTNLITPKSSRQIKEGKTEEDNATKEKDKKINDINAKRNDATNKINDARNNQTKNIKDGNDKKTAIESQRIKSGFGQNNEDIDKQLAAVDADTTKKNDVQQKIIDDNDKVVKDLDNQEANALSLAAQQLSDAAKKISEAQSRKDKVNKIVGKGMAATLGVGLGVATGGVGAIAGIGAIMGGVGSVVAGAVATGLSGLAGLAIKNNVDNAGKADLARVGNYNIKKIDNEKSSMAGKTKDEIMKIIKDPSSSPHEHAAAVSIALEEGHFGTGEAGNKAAAEQKSKVAANMKDEKVNNYLDAASKKNYVSTAPPFSTLKNPNATPEQKASANTKVAYGLEHNTMSIEKDMDAESIPAAIEGIVSGFRNIKSFVSQFDKSDDAKKQAIKVSLADHIKTVEAKENKTDADHEHLYKAKSQLASVNGYNLNSFGDSANLNDPIQRKNAEHKKRFLEGAGSEEIVKSSSGKNKQAFLEEIKVNLTANGDAAKIKGDYNHKDVAAVLAKIMPNASVEVANSTNKAITEAVHDHILNQNLNTPPKV